MALLSFFGSKNPTWQNLSDKGKTAMDRLDSQSAQDFFAQACELIGKEKGTNNIDYVSNRFWQGTALRRLALNEPAIKILTEAYSLHTPDFESQLPRYNVAMSLADVYFDLKQNEEAANYYAETAEIARQYEDSNSELYFALMFKLLHRFAQLEERERSYEYALEHYEHFLVLAKDYLGEDALDNADYVNRQMYYTQLKTALEAKQNNFAKAPLTVTYENGEEDDLEKAFLEYLSSELPDAQQQDLDKLFTNSQKVEVYQYLNGEKQLKGTIQQLDNFRKLLSIDDNLGGAYINPEDISYSFVFKTNDNTELAEIAYNNQVIFWPTHWKGDGSIIDEEALRQYIKRNF